MHLNLAAALTALAGLPAAVQAVAASSRPNIILVLTDDQDTHMNSLDHMPLLQKYLINEGTTFTKHYCTVAICCPSRVNLWTGQLAHNTNVTDVIPPFGGYPKFVTEGYNDNHLGLWMQESGYNTYYAGKLFNHHTVDNYNAPYVRGFTGSDFVLDPSTYQYWNFTTTHNGEKPKTFLGTYSPDFTAARAFEFLDEGLHAVDKEDKPFFLIAAPIAPHAQVVLYPTMEAGPPAAAERHQHLFPDYVIPRTPNFNPEEPSGVSWILNQPRLNDTVIDYNDEYQRQRLRSLQSVDEMVAEMVARLEAAGQLDNTYIIYTTDNGYHISQHRLMPGKECSFETDINVPLVIRGPGVPAGLVKDAVVSSHTDLAPTIMKLAGNALRDDFDGQPVAVHAAVNSGPEHVGTEFWGYAIPEGKYGYSGKYGFIDGPANAHPNNTYKGLRIETARYSLYYAVWCTNERQLYNMKTDPYQMDNILGEGRKSEPRELLLGRDLETVVDRLDALMLVMKSCKGQACVDPWGQIHPHGDVSSLADALAPRFDVFYKRQPKVAFTKCELGYFPEVEGPMDYHVFSRGVLDQIREQLPLVDPHWGQWT
ncbi:hypothetical protein SBRCBS47491_001413 [Sporothrix bragantina]|uniref:Arylsulfatase n=1 Tax=Sporothrix bragantina TaxID=671064 RepID=A0ABP0AYE7_9PEZI